MFRIFKLLILSIIIWFNRSQTTFYFFIWNWWFQFLLLFWNNSWSWYNLFILYFWNFFFIRFTNWDNFVFNRWFNNDFSFLFFDFQIILQFNWVSLFLFFFQMMQSVINNFLFFIRFTLTFIMRFVNFSKMSFWSVTLYCSASQETTAPTFWFVFQVLTFLLVLYLLKSYLFLFNHIFVFFNICTQPKNIFYICLTLSPSNIGDILFIDVFFIFVFLEDSWNVGISLLICHFLIIFIVEHWEVVIFLIIFKSPFNFGWWFFWKHWCVTNSRCFCINWYVFLFDNPQAFLFLYCIYIAHHSNQNRIFLIFDFSIKQRLLWNKTNSSMSFSTLSSISGVKIKIHRLNLK